MFSGKVVGRLEEASAPETGNKKLRRELLEPDEVRGRSIQTTRDIDHEPRLFAGRRKGN
jgi:hypothetical protein